MRSNLRTVGVSLLSSALLLCLTGTALADVYTVTRTDDPIPGPCEPGDCSLREAFAASNASTAVDDQIVIPASAIPYAVELESKPLEATDSVEVKGAAADRVQVKGNGSNFILFVTGAFPAVVLEGLTITGGKGGIQNNGDLTLRGVSIEGNKREGGGGGIQSNGPLKIEASFIGFNSATAASGGIHSNGAVTIVNSTIAHNSSNGIGGVGGNSSVAISSSSVVFNSTGTDSPGLGGSPLTVWDSIIAANKNSAGTLNCGSSTEIKSLGGNVSDDATCSTAATDRPNVDPRLGALALHGGTTPLYDLLAGSPAIDAASQCPLLDQRGAARPQGVRCDSGPYEFVPLLEPPPPPPGDRDFFMRVGKKLRLAKNAIRVRLTCPKSEVSPPCRGRIVINRLPLVLGGGLHTMRGLSLRGRFTIWPGRTKAVAVRRPRSTARMLPGGPGTWKVSVVIEAEDGAGNKWGYAKARAPLIRR